MGKSNVGSGDDGIERSYFIETGLAITCCEIEDDYEMSV